MPATAAATHVDHTLQAALQRCETEPIHLIGSVQPHGALLVMDAKPPHTIRQCSANVETLFGVSLDRVLGLPLDTLLGLDQIEGLTRETAGGEGSALSNRLVYAIVDNDVRQFQASLHPGETTSLLELEPVGQGYQPRDMLRLQLQMQEGISRLYARDDLDATLQTLAQLVRDMAGYDQVMIYRFDPDWEGEVVAESVDEARLHSYLGHRFPAGDIPPQARELYRRNPFRMYVDVEAAPSPLTPPTHPLNGLPPDLSPAVLRSFSPVHIEYLRNMGVRAVMSLSLMVDDKLWGLVACHHQTPKNLDHPCREALKFVGRIASLKMAALMSAERERVSRRINDTVSLLLELLQRKGPPTEQLWAFEGKLAEVIDATGLLLRVNGKLYRRGQLPDDATIDQLLPALERQAKDGVVVCDHLAAAFPAFDIAPDQAAGVLAADLDNDRGDGIYWFRTEKLREVKWAGNPEKIVVTDRTGGLRISPRQSFATWTETWRERCAPWRQDEIELASRVSHLLLQAFRLLIESSIRQPQPGNEVPAASFEALIDTAPLLGNLPAGVVVHAADTRILYANPRALELLRLTERQALGRQALRPEWHLIDENCCLLEVADYPVNRVLRSGEKVTGLVIGIVDQATPEPTWLLLHAYPQVDASGDRQVIVTFIDITDRQQIPFRQIVDMTHDAVMVTEAAPLDRPGPRIVYANRAFAELTGYGVSELVGQTPRLLQSPDTDRAALDRIRQKLERAEAARETLLNVDKNGNPYWIELTITPLLDHTGQAKHFVAIERDVTARMVENRQLRDAATSDALTGLANRRGFADRFAQWQQAADPSGMRCCVIAIDLDYFKRVNDKHGHAAGDTVLVMVARTLGEVLRRDDVCARFGGEEFMILLPHVGMTEALNTAERLRQAVAERVTTPDGEPVTISLGVAQWRSGDDLSSLLQRADASLYQAKAAGRNCVVAEQ